MERLQIHTMVWPDFHHLDSIARKDRMYWHLKLIANTITRTATLPFHVLKDEQPIEEDSVIKRSHSDSGRHVLAPTDVGRNWEYLNGNMEVPGCVWISQRYCPLLVNYGEWRVLLLGGEIFHTIHTVWNGAKKTWVSEQVTAWQTLDELT